MIEYANAFVKVVSNGMFEYAVANPGSVMLLALLCPVVLFFCMLIMLNNDL